MPYNSFSRKIDFVFLPFQNSGSLYVKLKQNWSGDEAQWHRWLPGKFRVLSLISGTFSKKTNIKNLFINTFFGTIPGLLDTSQDLSRK